MKKLFVKKRKSLYHIPKSSDKAGRTSKFVIPAKAGIQLIKELDSASSAE